MERRLFEERKRLFNAIQKPKLSQGGLNAQAKKLIWKPPTDQPDLLSSEVRRLIAQYSQNIREWNDNKEQA